METKGELREKLYSQEKIITELKNEIENLKKEKEKAVSAAILSERQRQYQEWLSSKEGKWIQNLIEQKINESISKLSLKDYSNGDCYYSESGISLLYNGKKVSSVATDFWESEG